MNRITLRITVFCFIILFLVLGVMVEFFSVNKGCIKESSNVICTLQIFPLDIDEANNIYPLGHDIDHAKKKGVVFETIKESKYQKIQAAYLATMNFYLNSIASIDDFQKKLDDYSSNFPQVDVSVYSKIGSCGRCNISIRNNAYIERLSDEQLEVFFSSVNDQNQLTITKDIISIVEETWKNIIFVKLDTSNDDVYEIIYDYKAINRMRAFNDSLVFEISYGIEYDENGNIPNDDYENDKYEYVSELAEEMERELSEKYNCNVAVFIKNK